MTQSDLDRVIDSVIEEKIASGDPAPKTWIKMAVVGRYPAIEGADSAFYTLCAFGHVDHSVRMRLSRTKVEEDASQGDLFPGFKHVQKRYTITRGGEQVIVPLPAMTRDEVLAKAAELRSFARGAMAHADELTAYAETVRAVA